MPPCDLMRDRCRRCARRRRAWQCLYHPRCARHRRAAGDRDPDAAGARSRHLEETGVYVQVIAGTAGSATAATSRKAIACGVDAVDDRVTARRRTRSARPRLRHWGMATFHPTLPRGTPARRWSAVARSPRDPSRPAHENDGTHEPLRQARSVLRWRPAATRRHASRHQGRGHGRPGAAD